MALVNSYLKPAGMLCALLCGAAAQAQSVTETAYPRKPIRLVLPFPPGGGTDAMARIIAAKLGEVLGQQMVIENRAGAAGNLAAEFVAKSPPDGYTLFMGFSSVMTANKSLYKNMAVDPIKDFTPITQLATSQYIVVVHPSVPARSIAQLVALAKARPGTLNYSSAGIASPLHLAGELFKSRAGVIIVHIAYKGGGPAATAVLSGEAQLTYGSIAASLQYIQSGRLRALAVTGLRRATLAPQLPTMDESGYKGFNVASWHSLVAPPGTPRDIVMRLHDETIKVLRVSDVAKLIDNIGYEPTGTTPEQLMEIIKTESAVWTQVIRDARITAD